jgi:hypothetical protein
MLKPNHLNFTKNELVNIFETIRKELNSYLDQFGAALRNQEFDYHKIKIEITVFNPALANFKFQDRFLNQVEMISNQNEETIYIDYNRISSLSYPLMTGLLAHEILRKYISLSYDESYIYSFGYLNSRFPSK